MVYIDSNTYPDKVDKGFSETNIIYSYIKVHRIKL